MGKEKRRKRNDGSAAQDDLDTSKPSAVFTPHKGGRSWTLSVALPGSIIANAKNHDSKTHLAGTIARALAVFSVDEIIIFDDGEEGPESTTPLSPITAQDKTPTYTAFSHPSHFLTHLLSYLETPPHLRKALFHMHPNLRTAGTLPSLDMPHHGRASEWSEYREGVSGYYEPGTGTYVDVGLAEPRLVEGVEIPADTRITVRLLGRDSGVAEAVAPEEPREKTGVYWGYGVRRCGSLSSVLTECPFDGGYDVSIGTSERGVPLSEAFPDGGLSVPFQHLLLVLGGVAGLETAAANDPELTSKGIGKANVGDLFDYWVNVLPAQGSRTIRTEEALWLSLMGTRPLVDGR